MPHTCQEVARVPCGEGLGAPPLWGPGHRGRLLKGEEGLGLRGHGGELGGTDARCGPLSAPSAHSKRSRSPQSSSMYPHLMRWGEAQRAWQPGLWMLGQGAVGWPLSRPGTLGEAAGQGALFSALEYLPMTPGGPTLRPPPHHFGCCYPHSAWGPSRPVVTPRRPGRLRSGSTSAHLPRPAEGLAHRGAQSAESMDHQGEAGVFMA